MRPQHFYVISWNDKVLCEIRWRTVAPRWRRLLYSWAMHLVQCRLIGPLAPRISAVILWQMAQHLGLNWLTYMELLLYCWLISVEINLLFQESYWGHDFRETDDQNYEKSHRLSLRVSRLTTTRLIEYWSLMTIIRQLAKARCQHANSC